MNTAARRILDPDDESLPADQPIPADEPLLRKMPPQPATSLESALADLSHELAAAGVTSVTDASATNTWDDIAHIDSWARRGVIRQRVNVLLAVDQVSTTSSTGGMPTDGPVRVLGAKVAAPSDGIADGVRRVREYGWPVAVHATEPDEVEAALAVIRQCGPPAWGRDRIEHLGLPVPGQLERISDLAIAVTTNPSFVTERGSKYRQLLSAVELEWLYPARSVLEQGIPLAAASDRPVTATTPLGMMAAAVRRRPPDPAAEPLGSAERITPDEALSLVTDRDEVDGPALDGWGARAWSAFDLRLDTDTVILSDDPRLSLERADVLATFVGGRMIWGPEEAARGDLRDSDVQE